MEGQGEKNELTDMLDSKGKKINVWELKKLIESPETEYEILMDAVDSISKIITQINEPHNHNPLETLQENQTVLYFQCLIRLRMLFLYTVYDVKIKDIIHYCRTKLNMYKNNTFINNLNELDLWKDQIFKAKSMDVEAILENPKLLNGKFSNQTILFHYVKTQILPVISQKILSINNHSTRYALILKSLNFLTFLFAQTELQIRIQKNTLIENRIFFSRYDKEVQSRETDFLPKMGIIINEGLLCPSDMEIQGKLFKLLRRLYGFWNEQIYSVLYLNIRNISLYCKVRQNQEPLIKEVTMFLYKIIHEKSDLKLIDLVQNSEDLHYLKDSEFYNSKAFTYSSEYGKIFDINTEDFPYYSFSKHIGSRETWSRVIIITKPNSLLTWEFSLQNYDIRFGIFKVSKGKKYTIEEYENKQNCKAIIKLQKYGENGDKKKKKGSAFVKNGVYHVVFDNSYSMVRGKDLVYSVKEMEGIM